MIRFSKVSVVFKFRTNIIMKLLVFTTLVHVLFVKELCQASSLEKELTLTSRQKEILDQFRQDILNALPHEYMKHDIYLIKWLREKNFNLQQAKVLLMNNLKWREENRMDDIMTEDFSYFEQEFPFWLDGRDNEDRPVGTADIGAWDPRSAIIAGNGENALRFALRSTEMGAVLVRQDQEAGKNVTQFTLIANMDGFNLLQHGCIRCIQFYIRYLLAFQNYYPGQVHTLFVVNTPAAFDVVLRIVYPFFSEEVKGFLKIYGTNKKEWQKAVLDVIPPDQIRRQFGGTRLSD